MARRDCDDRNELKIRDNLSGSDITLYYRMPTTSEKQAYHNACVKRVKNKVESNHAAARLNAGMVIITGFSGDSFERKVDGRYVPMSAIESDGNYFPEWRDWVRQNAADLVMLLAARVYDTSASIPNEEDEGEDEGDLEGK